MYYQLTCNADETTTVTAHNTDSHGEYILDSLMPPIQSFRIHASNSHCFYRDTAKPKVEWGFYAKSLESFCETVLVQLFTISDGFYDALPYCGTGIYAHTCTWRTVQYLEHAERSEVIQTIHNTLNDPQYHWLKDIVRVSQLDHEYGGTETGDSSFHLPFKDFKHRVTAELRSLNMWGDLALTRGLDDFDFESDDDEEGTCDDDGELEEEE